MWNKLIDCVLACKGVPPEDETKLFIVCFVSYFMVPYQNLRLCGI